MILKQQLGETNRGSWGVGFGGLCNGVIMADKYIIQEQSETVKVLCEDRSFSFKSHHNSTDSSKTTPPGGRL